MRHRTHRNQAARCCCMPGPDAAREHAKPGAKTAEHGNPFTHRDGCIHSELSLTTKPMPKQAMVQRLRVE